jgi:hypothetical protein
MNNHLIHDQRLRWSNNSSSIITIIATSIITKILKNRTNIHWVLVLDCGSHVVDYLQCYHFNVYNNGYLILQIRKSEAYKCK